MVVEKCPKCGEWRFYIKRFPKPERMICGACGYTSVDRAKGYLKRHNVLTLYLSEFKKRIRHQLLELSGFTDYGDAFLDLSTDEVEKPIFQIIDEVAREFPSLARLKEAVEMAASQLDFKAHGFSSRWILTVLRETYEAREKWFESEKEKVKE